MLLLINTWPWYSFLKNPLCLKKPIDILIFCNSYVFFVFFVNIFTSHFLNECPNISNRSRLSCHSFGKTLKFKVDIIKYHDTLSRVLSLAASWQIMMNRFYQFKKFNILNELNFKKKSIVEFLYSPFLGKTF